MFLVFSNCDFQFLTMTSRGGQYFYRFSSACRLIEYNSSIFGMKNSIKIYKIFCKYMRGRYMPINHAGMFLPELRFLD